MSTFTPDDIRGMVAALNEALNGGDDENEDDFGGFVDAPPREGAPVDMMYMVRKEGDMAYGYMLEENDRGELAPVPLPDVPDQDRNGEPSYGFEGKILSLEHYLKTSQEYEDKHKLRLRVEYKKNGETRQVLAETGMFTNSARSLLRSLQKAEDLQGSTFTFLMAPSTGENSNSNVLFIETYENGDLILSEEGTWPGDDATLLAYADNVRERLGQDPIEEDRPRVTESKSSGGNRSSNSSGGSSRSSNEDNSGRQNRRRSSRATADNADNGSSSSRRSKRRSSRRSERRTKESY